MKVVDLGWGEQYKMSSKGGEIKKCSSKAKIRKKEGACCKRGLFTKQVEMLPGNCIEWSTVKPYIPCPTLSIDKWCHTVIKVVHQHQEGGHWTNTKMCWKLKNKNTLGGFPIETNLIDKSKQFCSNNFQNWFFPNHGLNCTWWNK